jgi:hypothetical protein
MEKHDKFPGSSRTADSLEGDEKSKIDRNDSPSPEPAAAKPEPQLQKSNTAASEEWQYVTGLKRYAVVGVVTLACFILLLDTAIIATVDDYSPMSEETRLTLFRPFPRLPPTFIH